MGGASGLGLQSAGRGDGFWETGVGHDGLLFLTPSGATAMAVCGSQDVVALVTSSRGGDAEEPGNFNALHARQKFLQGAS
jgi:hypothetical protein